MLFQRKDGRTVVLHDHTFSIISMEHTFSLFIVRDGKMVNIPDVKIPEKKWQDYIKYLKGENDDFSFIGDLEQESDKK